jgi:hypothetical protein
MKKLLLSLVTMMVIANPILTQNSYSLEPIPDNVPDWIYNKQRNHVYRQRGTYNDAIYNVTPLALDLNAVAVGHAFAYEDLVSGKEKGLETDTFQKIQWVLQNPPQFMPDEGNISPTFGRKYGVLEQVFEWAHIFHAQTVDVLASTHLTDAEKETEIDKLYQFYLTKVPYAITGLPMNMGYLDGQSYSKAFRQKYPKINGLFWGYHWLQGSMYDLLYGKTLEEQRKAYEKVGQQYREKELYRLDRSFMPMFAELSPRFAKRFPYISNTFDNLHMLHDMVNDILASDWLTEKQKEEQITRAIWLVMAANHEGMEPGKNYEGNGLHDHRFTEGIPGMGLMPPSVRHEEHNPSTPQTPSTGHEGHNHENPQTPSTGHEGHNHENPETPSTGHEGHNPSTPQTPATGHEGHNHENPPGEKK